MTTIKVAKTLLKELNDLEKIFTSPLIRAVQTAEIFADELMFENDVELVNEMKNEASFQSFQKLIKANSNLNTVAFVGHEPKMTLLVRSFSDRKDFPEFSKSGVCLIDFEIKKESGKLEWYFDPKKMEFAK